MSDAEHRAIAWLAAYHNERIKAGETPTVNAESLADALKLDIGECRLIFRYLECDGLLRPLPAVDTEKDWRGEIKIIRGCGIRTCHVLVARARHPKRCNDSRGTRRLN